MPPGRGCQLSRLSWPGHSTARATNETTSTIAVPSRRATRGLADPSGRPARGANWITPASRRLNDELRDEWVPACVLGHVALQLEHARGRP